MNEFVFSLFLLKQNHSDVLSKIYNRSMTTCFSRDCFKHLEVLPFLHRRFSFLVTFYVARGCRGQSPWKFLSFALRRPPETLVFMSIVDLLPSTNTSFHNAHDIEKL